MACTGFVVSGGALRMRLSARAGDLDGQRPALRSVWRVGGHPGCRRLGSGWGVAGRALDPDSAGSPPMGGGRSGGGGGGSGGGGGGGGASWGRANPLPAIWGFYLEKLARYPLLTKMCTSLVGFGLGDVLAQRFLDKNLQLDTKRLFRMMSFGFLIHGSTGHYWYQALDRYIRGTGVKEVVSKVALDQLLWAPVFTAIFLGYTSLTSGATWDAAKSKIKADTFTGVRASWSVWPIAHAINFRFIPPSQRLLYINAVQVAYNMFLSILAQSKAGSVKFGGGNGAAGKGAGKKKPGNKK